MRTMIQIALWLTLAIPLEAVHAENWTRFRGPNGQGVSSEVDLPVKWSSEDNREFANVVLRGASRFLPALRRYVDRIPTPVVQYSGYYTRTEENWPLIGPLHTEGAYVVGALSGFGTMAACAAGSLCAAWMTDAAMPRC